MIVTLVNIKCRNRNVIREKNALEYSTIRRHKRRETNILCSIEYTTLLDNVKEKQCDYPDIIQRIKRWTVLQTTDHHDWNVLRQYDAYDGFLRKRNKLVKEVVRIKVQYSVLFHRFNYRSAFQSTSWSLTRKQKLEIAL